MTKFLKTNEFTISCTIKVFRNFKNYLWFKKCPQIQKLLKNIFFLLFWILANSHSTPRVAPKKFQLIIKHFWVLELGGIINSLLHNLFCSLNLWCAHICKHVLLHMCFQAVNLPSWVASNELIIFLCNPHWSDQLVVLPFWTTMFIYERCHLPTIAPTCPT